MFRQHRTMALWGPFAGPFHGLVSLLWGLAAKPRGCLGRGEPRRGHIQGKGTALSLAQLSLAMLRVQGGCPLPEAAPGRMQAEVCDV